MKKSNFKTKYAVMSQGKPSSPGRTAPVSMGGGAIGGGDDFKQKIGRNKIPWSRTGFKGSPSQSADSGFSSFLGRVNRGYEDDEQEFTMFPEQEDTTEDEQETENQPVLISDKIPKYTGGRSRASESKSMSNLRNFIREAVKEETEIQSKEYIVRSDSDDDEHDSDSVVDIKADDGNIVAQPRQGLQELRRYIRECLSEKLLEAKKNILKSDDAEEDKPKKKRKKKTKEASVSGNVAGYSAPISAPKNAKKFYSDMERAYHGKIIGNIPTSTPE